MLDFNLLPLFILASILLVISPGPDLLLISAYSSTRGCKAGIMISVGIFLAGIVQAVLVAFGLGHLMQTLPPLALAIKVIGAVYLSWLGLILIAAWLKSTHEPSKAREVKNLSSTDLILRGLLNNLLNPKALLFFSVFLPQFTSGGTDLPGQILTLGVLLSGIALTINCCFSFGFSRLGSYFGGKLKISRHIDGALGFLFLGLATRLVASK